MALIIEDGSGVANANSLATVLECKTYAALYGLELPSSDADIEILLVNAMVYMNSLDSKYQGYRYHETQVLCMPRESIYYYGVYIGGEITQPMKDGQCQLAVDANGTTLLAPGSGREVIEKKIGPLTTKWNPTGNSAPQYYPTAAFAILDPFFMAASSGINLLSYR